MEWTPDCWQRKPALQQPHYAPDAGLAEVLEQLAALPPIVTSWEVAALKAQLAEACQGKRLIGASFGPIVGAMVVDYLLAGGRWTGPRAGFNPAGWVSWALGFIVGILPNQLLPEAVRVNVPCAPVAAFVVGAVVYFLCAKVGMLSAVLPLAAAKNQAE